MTVSEIDEIYRLIAEYTEHGKPTLDDAFCRLKERWEAGKKDIFTVIHLFLLSWYLQIEPPRETGLQSGRELSTCLRRSYDFLVDNISQSDDVRNLIKTMEELAPWALHPVADEEGKVEASALDSESSGEFVVDLSDEVITPLLRQYL